MTERGEIRLRLLAAALTGLCSNPGMCGSYSESVADLANAMVDQAMRCVELDDERRERIGIRAPSGGGQEEVP